jgi:hypothetical protein
LLLSEYNQRDARSFLGLNRIIRYGYDTPRNKRGRGIFAITKLSLLFELWCRREIFHGMRWSCRMNESDDLRAIGKPRPGGPDVHLLITAQYFKESGHKIAYTGGMKNKRKL